LGSVASKRGEGHPIQDEAARLRDRLEDDWGIPEAPAREILEHYAPLHFDRGEVIFPYGASSDVVFVAVSGIVKLYAPKGDDEFYLVEIAGPADILGPGHFVDYKNRRCQLVEARALTKCTVALFTRQRIEEILRRLDADALLQLLELVNARWSKAWSRSVMLLNLSFQKRLYAVFQDLAARFGVNEARGTLLIPELGHQDFADLIGSSRPLVTKLLAEMVSQGMIGRSGKRYIVLKGGGLDKLPPIFPCRLPTENSGSWSAAERLTGRAPSATERFAASYRPLNQRNGV
jgi:CRP-like cAMP-binding protein